MVSLNAKVKQNNIPKSAKILFEKKNSKPEKILHLQKLPAKKTLSHRYSMATTQESCIASPLPNALSVTELWLQSPNYSRKL
ncbi:MAG: phage repressor protein C with HTH and peptisase S24 domain [Candidatus Azotimanducaceae bacterium]